MGATGRDGGKFLRDGGNFGGMERILEGILKGCREFLRVGGNFKGMEEFFGWLEAVLEGWRDFLKFWRDGGNFGRMEEFFWRCAENFGGLEVFSGGLEGWRDFLDVWKEFWRVGETFLGGEGNCGGSGEISLRVGGIFWGAGGNIWRVR